MTPARRERVEEIVLSALELQGEARWNHIDAACGPDAELRQEVESLLACQDRVVDFLETPALDFAARALAASESSILQGRIVGPYRIELLLGAGGMGEVYRAWDTRLARPVALKFLPREYLGDRLALERFRREARAASGLNHPNICTIYDVGDLDSRPFIAMEYLEGETLRSRMRSGALARGDALGYTAQIAHGLAAAHEKAIVHRDLKPENVWITPEGRVKILDFGLAKVIEPGPRRAGGSLETEPGRVMGTAGYMSPEQVRGRAADQRSDIFALGAVLHEMLTGKRAFDGPSAADVISAILKDDPEPLPDPALNRFVRRCLAKKPEDRFQSARDVLSSIEKIDTAADSGRLRTLRVIFHPRRMGQRVMAAVVVLTPIAAIGIALVWFGTMRKPPAAKLGGGRLALLASSAEAIYDPALSNDGKMIAYIADEHGKPDLYVGRVVGGGRVRLTYDGGFKNRPRFSPDGERLTFTRYIGGSQRSEVWMIPVLGGEPVRLLADARDADWSPDGSRIAFVAHRDTVAVSKADGTGVHTVVPSEAALPYFRTPAWSPDGSKLAFVKSSGGALSYIWLVSLPGGQQRKLTDEPPPAYNREPAFTPDGSAIVYASSRAGSSNLWLVPLDGSPKVRLTTGPGPDESPSVARDGSVAFVNTRMRCALIVEDIAARVSREILTYSYYIWAPVFSPDGSEIAYTQAERNGAWHISVAPAAGGSPRQVTSGPVPGIYPRFSPDGSSIFYFSWNPGSERILRVPRTGGPAEVVVPGAGNHDDDYPDVSPDGRWVAFSRTQNNATRLYVAPLTGGDPSRITDQPATTARWSPDGKWIAFSPTRDYATGIYIVRPDGSGLRRISELGGFPAWSPDGTTIAYLAAGPDGNQQILSSSLAGGKPKRIPGPRFRGSNFPFDMSRDGRLLATSNCSIVAAEVWLLEPQQR